MSKLIDLTGQKFGRLTVLYRVNKNNNRTFWHCICECGNEKDVDGKQLRGGFTKSCGCLNKELISERTQKDYTGKKFGKLTLLERLPNYKGNRTYYRCLCDCGTIKNICGSNIVREHTTSCGCQSSRKNSKTKSYNFLYQYRDDSREKIYKVYKHTSPNGKCYIGMTKQTLEKRSRNGEGYNTQKRFYNAIKKYGWDNFEHEVLEDNLTHDEACEREIYYIKLWKSNQMKFGYNITSGGDGCKDRGKALAQIKDGQVVNVFKTIKEASKKFNMSDSSIGNYVLDKRNHAGYSFRLISDNEYIEFQNVKNKKDIYAFQKKISAENSKKISDRNKNRCTAVCKYSLNGKFLKIYDSVMDAQNDIKNTNISYAIRHKGSAGGFLWKYDDGDYSNIKPYHANGKKVHQIDKDTKKILATYDSMVDAERATGIKFKQIWKVCNGQTKTASGYIWRYEGDINNLEINIVKGVPKKVYKIDRDTKEIICEYDSMTIAAKENNIKSMSKISDVCKGKAKTAGGYIWRYADEDDKTTYKI